MRFLRVPLGRLAESLGGGGAKRGEASRAGVAGEIVYMLSRFYGWEEGCHCTLVRRRWFEEAGVVEQRGMVELSTEIVTVCNEGTGEVRREVVAPQARCRKEIVKGRLHGGCQELARFCRRGQRERGDIKADLRGRGVEHGEIFRTERREGVVI